MKKSQQKLLFILIGVIIILAAVFWGIQSKEQTEFEAQNAVETVNRPELGFSFGYTAGPDALSMVEPPVSGQPLEAAFIIMPSSEYVAFANGEDEDVGPTISLFVFQYGDDEMPVEVEMLGKAEKLMAWAQENQSITSINNTTSDITDFELDGLRGISYESEETYKQDIRLFRLGDRHYMFVGQYQSNGDDMDKYFDEVLSTIKFD